MRIEIHKTCKDFTTYRAERVKSLFNAASGANFKLEAELPIEGFDWSLGLILGPSGSGKTSMGQQIFGDGALQNLYDGWPAKAPIIDAILSGGEINQVTASLSAVGLGDVPAWLRPFSALSIGEQPVCHLAVCPFFNTNAYRATRLVVMPEWQGAGVGLKFLNAVCQAHLDGLGRLGRRLPTMFHTSHPNLIRALLALPKWILKSQQLFGGNKAKSRASISKGGGFHAGGYGGHFRAVQGFKYVG